LGFIY